MSLEHVLTRGLLILGTAQALELLDDVYDLEPHRLQGETEAEDDVVGARDPDGALGFEDAASLLQPPDVEPVILSEPYRANRVTTPCLALPGAFGG
jgi:hypothetical protein